jgi:hypothetical protein
LYHTRNAWQEMEMLRQLMAGRIISVCNITIHAPVITVPVRTAQNASTIRIASPFASWPVLADRWLTSAMRRERTQSQGSGI